MTRYEHLAKALSLHFQRICELTSPKGLLELPSAGTRQDLMGCFEFVLTVEGHEYWWALATGEGFT